MGEGKLFKGKKIPKIPKRETVGNNTQLKENERK